MALTNFEVGRLGGGAGEEPREHHVHWDVYAPTDIPVRYLNVLDLSNYKTKTRRECLKSALYLRLKKRKRL